MISLFYIGNLRAKPSVQLRISKGILINIKVWCMHYQRWFPCSFLVPSRIKQPQSTLRIIRQNILAAIQIVLGQVRLIPPPNKFSCLSRARFHSGSFEKKINPSDLKIELYAIPSADIRVRFEASLIAFSTPVFIQCRESPWIFIMGITFSCSSASLYQKKVRKEYLDLRIY